MPFNRRRNHRIARAAIATLVAALCHGVALTLLWLAGAFNPLTRTALPTLVSGEVERLREADEQPLQIESLVEQLQRPAEPTEAEKRQKKEEESQHPHGQVVDIARPAIEQRPDEARYLSEYDSTVQHETRGPTGRDHAGAPQPSALPTPPQPASLPSPPTPPASPAPQRNRSMLAMRAPEAQKVPGPLGADSAVQRVGPDGTLPHRAGQGEVRPPLSEAPSGGGPPAAPPQLNLSPSRQALAHALGQGAGSSDYLGEIDDGDSTALNAKKWKFAAFFNRIKDRVREEWHPDSVMLRHDPSGNIYGIKDRVTVLRVHLLPTGRLADVQILRPSGIEFLDDEALSAFRRAQPFDNPPKQLIEGDGKIHFNFAFIVELSGHTSLKWFKYGE